MSASPVNGGNSGTSGVNGVEKDNNDNTKCLEDPNFSFDEPKASKSDATAKTSDKETKPPVESSQPGKTKKPSYRVLEDPELDIPASAGGFKSDPMTTSIYQPKQ